MYIAAVKFGRMSKKQRERVEDEANFHKRNRMNGITEAIPYPNGTPTTNNNQYPGYAISHYTALLFSGKKCFKVQLV